LRSLIKKVFENLGMFLSGDSYKCYLQLAYFGFEDFYESRTAENTLQAACPSIHPGTSVKCVLSERRHKMLCKIPAEIQNVFGFSNNFSHQ
jgi:hypothetical protein